MSNDASKTRGRWFATTHWSVVLEAGAGTRSGASEAREELCRTYWQPLYAYLRRGGRSIEDAQDLVQSFLSHFIERDLCAEADETRGHFRSFLLACFKHFVSDDWDRARARRRGGHIKWVSLGLPQVESQFAAELSIADSPEDCYDRRWAIAVMTQAMESLQDEYRRLGKEELFKVLKSFFREDGAELSYSDAAGRLNLSLSAVKSAILRLRRHFRERLRWEVAQTVTDPDQLDEELRHLIRVLGR